jgi:hypothetical protein
LQIDFSQGCHSKRFLGADAVLEGKMRSQVYYLSLASFLSGRSGIKGPRVLGMAFCLSHTSILQDDASGVFDKGSFSGSVRGGGH